MQHFPRLPTPGRRRGFKYNRGAREPKSQFTVSVRHSSSHAGLAQARCTDAWGLHGATLHWTSRCAQEPDVGGRCEWPAESFRRHTLSSDTASERLQSACCELMACTPDCCRCKSPWGVAMAMSPEDGTRSRSPSFHLRARPPFPFPAPSTVT